MRRDGGALLRFLYGLPEGRHEQARIVVDGVTLRAILDLVCHNADYFPIKKE
jgi:hypothetical protein